MERWETDRIEGLVDAAQLCVSSRIYQNFYFFTFASPSAGKVSDAAMQELDIHHAQALISLVWHRLDSSRGGALLQAEDSASSQ